MAPVATRNLKDAVTTRKDPEVDPDDIRRWEIDLDIAARRAARRADVMEAYAARQVTRAEAAEALGISIQHVRWLRWHHKKFGRLPDHAPFRRPPAGPDATQVMLERFAAPGAMETYDG